MHSVKPEPHIVTHEPRAQNCPRGQTLPQVPQLRTSLAVLAHTSPPPRGVIIPMGSGQRASSSSSQRMRQRPSTQVYPSMHWLPHAPQLFRSLMTSAQ
jgi:hypothetical protein